MADIDPTPQTGLRERKKDEVRTRIKDEMIQLLSEGELDVSHDQIAERTGISRRTVYRYFPDKEALLEGVHERVRELAGKNVIMPRTEADLVGTLHDVYTGFDKIAPITTLIRSTPIGRAVRLAGKKRRVESYTAATADAVKDLPPEDRMLATAVLQFLHTTAWLEMHDHWNLEGAQMARAMSWAMRTLLRDLRKRKGKPLDEDVD